MVGEQAANDPVIRALADDGLYIGITAWSEPSLVDSGELYPPTVRTAEERLRFYTRHYPITEVGSSFYRPVAARTANLWAARTPPGNRRALPARPADRGSHGGRRGGAFPWAECAAMGNPRRACGKEGRPVHLLMNNVYRGYAVRSARILAELLAERG
jgi:uncharacterized protein DUF72